MEAASLVLSAAQTLFGALQNPDLRQLFSQFGKNSELERMEDTVSCIKAVLLDAEAKEVLSRQEHDFVEKLRIVVYDADDLLDEFTTIAELEKLRLLQEDVRVLKKVHLLFSCFRKLFDAYNMSREIKRIRKKLDGIAEDASKFSFKFDYQPIRRRREQTCSYVYHPNIIGREDDLRRIVDILVDVNHRTDEVFCLTIVGMGGLGKTALAQLVFNDERVNEGFQLRMWVCVADQDQQHFDVWSILVRILESATGQKHDGSCLELVQSRLRKQLQGKKYLLVLDDVWTEEYDKWLKLEGFLKDAQKGSMIVVTTRSKATAVAVGSGFVYELEGLSHENSWRLFEMTVGQEQANSDDLVDIGQAIVKGCVNIPLAIKVVGALLYGQGKAKWQAFQQGKVIQMSKDKSDILPILKFSYHHLSPSLKSCFSYCAIFPKDFVIKKETLIRLWIAQGYIQPLNGESSIEQAGEECFFTLLHRCFFQDVQKDEYGEIDCCKIHDLMHDIAQEVTEKEICIADLTMSRLGTNVRHMFYALCDCRDTFFTTSKIRTYLHGDMNFRGKHFPVVELLANLQYLRALDLSCLSIKILPDAISKLLHLRYLDLHGNSCLARLPETITELHNLQTLNLSKCINLEALPTKLSKLVKLSLLDINVCYKLTCMPSGMERLTNLCRLTTFIIAGAWINSTLQQCISGLKDLRTLRNLRGHLDIVIKKGYIHGKGKDREAGYLSNKDCLVGVNMQWPYLMLTQDIIDDDEVLLEDLRPHSNLRELSLANYGGIRMPWWAREGNLGIYLPNLVHICLRHCTRLQVLSWLHKLRFLRSLQLVYLTNLEYIEGTSCSLNSSGSAETELQSFLFPSLESLWLADLQNLKGWSSMVPHVSISFPHLSSLHVSNCPSLKSVFLCPSLQMLALRSVNEMLRITVDENQRACTSSASSSSSSLSFHPSAFPLSDFGKRIDPEFGRVEINNVKYLKSVHFEAFRSPVKMKITRDVVTETLLDVSQTFRSYSSSLIHLDIRNCSKLTSLSGGGLEHLRVLEILELENLPNLSFDEEEEGDELPWRSWSLSMHSLRLNWLPKLVSLPKGMRQLTFLKSLDISLCPLEYLPEWIGCLSSLHSLQIKFGKLKALPHSMQELTSLSRLQIISCPAILKERCQSPDGEDWPKVQHIPCLDIIVEPDYSQPHIYVSTQVNLEHN